MGPRAVVEERDARRDVERRDRIAALAGDPQQLPARDEDPQVRRGPDEPARPVGAGRQELLEVVEDEEHRSGRGGGRGAPRRWAAPWTRGRRSSSRSAASTRAGSRTRREVDEPGAVRKAARDGPGDARARGGSCRCRRARSASRSGSSASGLADDVDLGLAADERGDVAGQVGRRVESSAAAGGRRRRPGRRAGGGGPAPRSP